MIDNNTKYLKCDAEQEDIQLAPLYLNFDIIQGFSFDNTNRIFIDAGPGMLIIELNTKLTGSIISPDNPYAYSPPALNMCAQALNELFDEVNTYSPKSVYELPTFFGYSEEQLSEIIEGKEREVKETIKEGDKLKQAEVTILKNNSEREIKRAEEQGATKEEIALIEAKYSALIDDKEAEIDNQTNQLVKDIINREVRLDKILIPIARITYEENL